MGIGTHLLKNLAIESEGKTILNSIVRFKDLNCGINKYILWLFERHKHNTRTNTIISINVLSVTSGKHSDHDAEPASFVICTLLNN